MNSNRNIRKFVGLALSVLLLSMTPAVFAGVSGAIFTTDVTGNFVNANVYDDPYTVYLNGGPRPNAPCSAAGLPNGDYYFQVTDPSGSELLSMDDVLNRIVKVSNGVITAYLGDPFSRDVEPTGQCNSVTVQLSPYNDTLNAGGEYKVWMSCPGFHGQLFRRHFDRLILHRCLIIQ